MKKNIYIAIGVALLTMSGCYKDKGSYDYKDVNDVKISFSPSAADDRYTFNQPPTDTLIKTFQVTLDQTLESSDNNIEYTWIVTKGSKKDTIKTSSLTLKFPPKEKTVYDVMFIAHDNNTQLDYYKQLSFRTTIPYVNCIFVLHGTPNDMKVAAIEMPDSIQPMITYDVNKEITGQRRFQNANCFTFLNDGLGRSSSGFEVESMEIFEPDSAFFMYAFDMGVRKKYDLMFPPVTPKKQTDKVVSDGRSNAIIICKDGTILHGGKLGYFYTPTLDPSVSTYKVTHAFVSQERYCTLWDEQNKRFLYYNFQDNSYPWMSTGTRDDAYIYASLTSVPTDILDANEFDNKTMIWMGQSISNDFTECTAIMYDNTTSTNVIYNFAYGESKDEYDGKGGGEEEKEETSFVRVDKADIGNMGANSDSKFATNMQYSNQIFFSQGSTIYLYNTLTQDKISIYELDPSDIINNIKFRLTFNHYLNPNSEKHLVISVTKANGNGEVHDILLTESGDLENSNVYSGFGPVIDTEFTWVERRIDF